jgi:hypothetical protein
LGITKKEIKEIVLQAVNIVSPARQRWLQEQETKYRLEVPYQEWANKLKRITPVVPVAQVSKPVLPKIATVTSKQPKFKSGDYWNAYNVFKKKLKQSWKGTKEQWKAARPGRQAEFERRWKNDRFGLHLTRLQGTCHRKVRLTPEEAAFRWGSAPIDLDAYVCDVCGFIHLTKSRKAA